VKININKLDIIKNLSKNSGFSVNFSKKLINDLILILINNIKNGGLTLKNIGTFKILHKKERLGRNPKTKEEFKISSRKSISFIPSKNFNLPLRNK
jgi:nucleoid DNA-binding protein